MLNPTESAGQLVARTLAGSWRAALARFQLEYDDLSSITPLLLGAGAAGLAWRRLRTSNLAGTLPVKELLSEYRRSTALAVIQRQRIESVVQAFQAAGVDPILVKGWVAARLYPDEGLRPYADIDLCVERGQFAAAREALDTQSETGVIVDLHREFATLGDDSWEEVHSRSQVIRLGQTDVRAPSSEDHLRILSIHMLREGAWRPLWLCDVAAAVESRPDNFDWRICFGQSKQTANWITCALKLAHELLGSDISGTPVAAEVKPLPRWLTRTVLKEWGTPAPSMILRHQAPMASHLRAPASLASGFRHRWPNAIEGTVVSGGLFNDLPRLPFQFTAYMKRGAQFAFNLPKLRREP